MKEGNETFPYSLYNWKFWYTYLIEFFICEHVCFKIMNSKFVSYSFVLITTSKFTLMLLITLANLFLNVTWMVEVCEWFLVLYFPLALFLVFSNPHSPLVLNLEEVFNLFPDPEAQPHVTRSVFLVPFH